MAKWGVGTAKGRVSDKVFLITIKSLFSLFFFSFSPSS